ncbi:MAG: hypothetical protein LBC06_01510 [Rickettsiales bacterium]|jgi:hypothetical protein|nr:hypothetical protein [Rickettsiales bacterium]
MPNIDQMNQELVRTFNINLCYNSTVVTNLTVQNLYGEDYIVISFDKNMDSKQYVGYLSDIEERIVKRFYKNKQAAGVCFNLESFPFAFNKGQLCKDNQEREKFLVPMDEGVVFNLKSYLANAFIGDTNEDIGNKFGEKYAKKYMGSVNFNRDFYLHCMQFRDKTLQDYFVSSFSSKIQRYENAPGDYLKVKGDCVYIKKGIFDNVEFIKDIEAHNASLICRDFQTPSAKNKVVENLKFPIVDFIRRMGIPIHSMLRTSYEGSVEDSILVPIVNSQLKKGGRFLDSDDADKINSVFNMEVLSDLGQYISIKLPKSDNFDGVVYAIDFSDLDISCCVMNTIMENSVINKNHELTIDPELQLSLSLPLKKKPRLSSSSSVNEDEGACAGLPKSMDSSLDEACTAPNRDRQPSSVMSENRLTQLTDQQARSEDARLPARFPKVESQSSVVNATLDVGEGVPGPSGNSLKLSEPYSPPISPTSEDELPDRGESPVADCCYSTGGLLKKMNSVLSFSSRSSSSRSSRSSHSSSNLSAVRGLARTS